MATAKEKAALAAAEKEAAEKAAQEAADQAAEQAAAAAENEAAEKAAAEQAEQEAAALAEQEAEEKAAQEAAEKTAAEEAEAEAEAAAQKAEKAQDTGPSGIMKVFCKLPSGMTFAMPGGDVTLKGASGSKLLGGYGVTFMSAPAWEALEARYGGMDVFKKKIVFAEESMTDGAAVAQEMSGEKTGFEGVDPKNPGKDLEPGAK